MKVLIHLIYALFSAAEVVFNFEICLLSAVKQAQTGSILTLGMHTIDVWFASYNCNAHP